MPVGDLGEAYAVADRVRRNFCEAAGRFANGDLVPTVSVGLTVATAPLEEAGTPVARAPSIVPLIKTEPVTFPQARGWRRRVAH
ncbi:MAG: hypothetical protein ABWZ64_09670 [Xanthobacteraceae bacterium]|jgi:hypothetical protein